MALALLPLTGRSHHCSPLANSGSLGGTACSRRSRTLSSTQSTSARCSSLSPQLQRLAARQRAFEVEQLLVPADRAQPRLALAGGAAQTGVAQHAAPAHRFTSSQRGRAFTVAGRRVARVQLLVCRRGLQPHDQAARRRVRLGHRSALAGSAPAASTRAAARERRRGRRCRLMGGEGCAIVAAPPHRLRAQTAVDRAAVPPRPGRAAPPTAPTPPRRRPTKATAAPRP